MSAVSAQASEADWYLDNVLLPSLGTAEAAYGRWQQRARELRLRHPAVATLALRQGFVLSREQARGIVGEAEIRRHVRAGRWWLPRRGVLATVPRTADDAALLTATAAVRAREGHVVSHRSAALLHSLPVIAMPTDPELTAPAAAYSRAHSGALVRTAWLEPDEFTSWFGAPLTTVARTIVDLARTDRAGGLVAADAALRERLTTAAELVESLARAGPVPGIVAAREVLAFGSGLAESPLESLTRLCLADQRLPAPQLQVRITDPVDGWFCRVDLLWREQRVVVEADGLSKYTDVRTLRAEKLRQERLERLGYRVVRVTWDDVTRDPVGTGDRVRAALAARVTPRRTA